MLVGVIGDLLLYFSRVILVWCRASANVAGRLTFSHIQNAYICETHAKLTVRILHSKQLKLTTIEISWR